MPQNSSAINYLVLSTALSRFARPPAELAPDEVAALRAEARRQYAVQDAILAAPEAVDVVVADAVVADAVATVARRYDSEQALQEDLEHNDLDRDGLATALARELRVEAVVERITAAAGRCNDEELEIYYLQHRDRYSAAETRVVRHLLITVNEAYPENGRRAARRRIEKLAAEVAQAPERFADLAQRHSECPSAMHGGVIGRVPRGTLYPALDDVLFHMEEGAVSGPVESEMGFHVLQCERVVPAGPLPFDLVRDKIAQVLEQRKRKAYLREWLRRRGPQG